MLHPTPTGGLSRGDADCFYEIARYNALSLPTAFDFAQMTLVWPLPPKTLAIPSAFLHPLSLLFTEELGSRVSFVR